MSDLFKTLRQVVQKATINHEDDQKKEEIYLAKSSDPVSYTHLTLPTKA